jgi:hypothetical protein
MAERDSFDDLRNKRLRYVDSARENGFEEGLRLLLAELYPDNAHFIYELLQNAEDARATVVEFELNDHALIVSHDGDRAFTLADIESITGIGKSTKKDDETQIGKFGVGFKAVFAYTTRPEIRSGEFSFAIADLFVPELTGDAAQPGRTIFKFPFDRPEKPAAVACEEIERGLRELNEKTLLFLNSIREITYALPAGDVGFVKRTDVDDVTIRVETSQDEGFVESIWLRLVGPASTAHKGQNPLTVAAAFKLEPKETGRTRSAAKADTPAEAPLGIVALPTGDVSIYFPAVKESSRLKFHIHAPFASTVARDSVRDTAENAQLVADIGDLIVRNLNGFRDKGLIDDGFLAALPNAEDDLRPIYGQVRSAIVEAFNAEAVTPVRRGGFGAARTLVSSPSEFRAGLDQTDLRFLMELAEIEFEDEPRWILDRDARPGRFLRDLDTIQFGWAELDKSFAAIAPVWSWVQPDVEVLAAWHRWLEAKDDDTLLSFYEFLGHGVEGELGTDLEELPLVRLRQRSRSKHVKGPETHLPSRRSDDAKSHVPVELAYFDDDEDSKRSNNLRSFYHAAGVKRWDERAKIDSRLAAYRAEAFPEDGEAVPAKHLADMKAFVKFGLSEPLAARSMFGNVHFIRVADEDGNLIWGRPSNIFLDEPFRSTGLAALYAGDEHKYPLPGFYLEIEGIDDFLVSVGAAAGIEIVPSTLALNPKYERSWAYGKNENYNTVRRDWDISKFDAVVVTADPTLLRSVWDAISSTPAARAVATYQANGSYAAHKFDSLAFQRLTATAWIPSGDGELKRPGQLTLDQLPPDWSTPAPGSLAASLPFGVDAARQEQQESLKPVYASKLGIELADAELIKEARAAGVDIETALHELIALKRSPEPFPEAASEDPNRRSSVAASDALGAANHQTDIRSRRVVVGQTQSSEESKSYLREQYTNSGGEMYCQACHGILPFKLKGDWYFQAIQFVGGRKRVHRQNALAMCPLCAALYRHKRETTDEVLLESLSALDIEPGQGAIELPVLINGRVVRLRFTGKHGLDLQSAMAVAGEERGAD